VGETFIGLALLAVLAMPIVALAIAIYAAVRTSRVDKSLAEKTETIEREVNFLRDLVKKRDKRLAEIEALISGAEKPTASPPEKAPHAAAASPAPPAPRPDLPQTEAPKAAAPLPVQASPPLQKQPSVTPPPPIGVKIRWPREK